MTCCHQQRRGQRADGSRKICWDTLSLSKQNCSGSTVCWSADGAPKGVRTVAETPLLFLSISPRVAANRLFSARDSPLILTLIAGILLSKCKASCSEGEGLLRIVSAPRSLERYKYQKNHAATSSTEAYLMLDACLDSSLVLVCYNEEAILENNVRQTFQILDQTTFSYEILFVDDCSRDRTRELIDRVIRENPERRLTRIFHEKNKGRGSTVADGMRAASGEIGGYIDLDLEVHAR